MSSSPFLPLPTGLEIVSIETVEDLLRVQVASTKQRASCPLCHCPSERRHSHYTRVVADLPCAGFRVQLILHVRKFFCDAVDCARRIFDLSASSLCRPLGTGDSSPASSLGSRWDSYLWRGRHTAGRAVGPADFSTTLLRRIMALPTEAVGSVKQLGVDDFGATRKVACVAVRTLERRIFPGVLPSSAEPSLNQVRLGQCSRARQSGH
jgi:hypothetical protein